MKSRGLPITLTRLARPCLVIGGGTVAERKVKTLLDARARVRLVAPEVTDALRRLAEEGRVDWRAQPYEANALEGAGLVIAATDEAEVNHRAADEARARGLLVNVVDDPEYCDFVMPAIVRRGDLTVSVCTSGSAPALSGHLRARLETEFGLEWEAYVERLGAARPALAAQYPDAAERRAAWDELLEEAPPIPDPLLPSAALRGPSARQAGERELGLREGDSGFVSLVGAGPGDSGLITVRGLEALRRADVIVYDRLVAPELAREARPDAELIYVGKAASEHTLPQAEIERLLVERAQQGKRVVRLKGGDPFVFGRGGEEALALAAAGIPFEVIPGVTSAIAVPAAAGIPVTHRGLASSVMIVTAHQDPTRETSGLDWAHLAAHSGTLVFLMGTSQLSQVVEQLVAHGRAGDTPAAIIERGTTPQQRVVSGTLADIAERAAEAHIEPPAITVVGPVVALAAQLSPAAEESA